MAGAVVRVAANHNHVGTPVVFCSACGYSRFSQVDDLIEASSLGTPEAKAARASVSDDEARRVVARAKELGAAGGQT